MNPMEVNLAVTICGNAHFWHRCALEFGHDGDHVERSFFDGFSYCRWSNPFGDPPDVSTWFADVLAGTP